MNCSVPRFIAISTAFKQYLMQLSTRLFTASSYGRRRGFGPMVAVQLIMSLMQLTFHVRSSNYVIHLYTFKRALHIPIICTETDELLSKELLVEFFVGLQTILKPINQQAFGLEVETSYVCKICRCMQNTKSATTSIFAHLFK